ncbi:MAG TPA: ferrous iron transporter B, partial [Firmicutes bacterium]|nr:ferrous iron transporter B [Bacillota bacterium]
VLSTFMVSWVLSKTILKGVPSSFILELPPYRKPKVFQVIARSFRDRTIFVLQRAILVAAPCGAITWLLANTPVRGSTMLSMMAGALEPAGSIMGMDGTILLAFILGFPANEIVIPIALMSYLSQQAMSQATSLIAMESVLFSYGWTWMTAVSVMLFSLLHFPCGTTVYTIYKETGSKKWTALSMLIPTVFACIVLILLQGVFHVLKG